MKSNQQVSFADDPYNERSRGMPKSTITATAFDSWEVGSRYSLLESLGKGSYGQVAKAVDRVSGKHVAIKQMKRIFDEPTDAKRAYREMHILRHLKHPSIVALLDVISSTINASYLAAQHPPIPRSLGNIYLVFEFVDTDLSKILKSNQYLTLEHIQYMLYQLIDGIKYIHKTNVIHRDLKPANVLVCCNDCTVKIADFGLSRVVGSDQISNQPMTGADGLAFNPRDSIYYPADESEEMDYEESTDSPQSWETDLNNSSTQNNSNSLSQAGPKSAFQFSSLPQRNSIPGSNPANGGGGPLKAPLPAPLPLKRGLTKHVVTRWYRAPEVILLQPYTAAVDMWSLGCIFAELLGLLRENIDDFRRRRALFPGESCGELSAEDLKSFSSSYRGMSAKDEHDEQFRVLAESYKNNRSQLNIIFEVLGTPSDLELNHLDKRTSDILRGLPSKTPKTLDRLYPNSGLHGLSLMMAMLRFNPADRISAEEALDHPYFDDIKRKGYINTYRTNNQHIFSEQEGSSASAALKPIPMDANLEKIGESSDHLRQNVIQEVLFYRSRDQRDRL